METILRFGSHLLEHLVLGVALVSCQAAYSLFTVISLSINTFISG